MNLEEIKEYVSKRMMMDANLELLLELILATSVSIELNRPIWLMIIAPPSSGKTQLLKLLERDVYAHILTNITGKFLFSAHPSARGGYMAREVKSKGLLLFPDFTTVLSRPPFVREQIFNQLRVIYDGQAGLGSGIDFQAIQNWEGKIGVISCVTETIERFKNTSSDLGERFLYYNYSPPKITNSSINYDLIDNEFDTTFYSSVRDFIVDKREDILNVKIEREDEKKLVSLAIFIADGRRRILRDGRTRVISSIHNQESPYRVLTGLKSIYTSLMSINENNNSQAIRAVKEIASSTIPSDRARIIKSIYNAEAAKTINDLVDEFKIDETVIRRTCEELEVLDIITLEKSKQYRWILNKDFRKSAPCLFN